MGKLQGGRNFALATNKISQETYTINAYIPDHIKGESVTLSFYLELENGTSSSQSRIGVEGSNSTTTGIRNWYGCWHYLSNGASFKGRVASSNLRIDKDFSGNTLTMTVYTNLINADIKRVGYVKLEKGSTATPWTPAPEDLGLEYPNHVTKFDTYFKDEDLVTNELVEFPEELRGGRNYLLDSLNFNTQGGNAAGISREIKNGILEVTAIPGNSNYSSGWGMIGSSSVINKNIKKGDIVTFSMEAKSTDSSDIPTIYFGPGMGYLQMNGSMSSEWSTIYITREWSATSWSPHIGFSGKSGTFQFRKGKLEKGSKTTPWTPAPEDLGLDYPSHITHFGTYFKESNVLGYDLIGGRNLIPNSHQEKTSSREYVLYDNLTPIFDKYGLGEYTFSFDVKGAIAGPINVYYSDRTTSQIKYGWRGAGNVNATTEYQRFSFTVDVFELTPDANQSSLAFYGTYDSGRIPSIKNVKIERGSVATPWTPAPEDLGLEYPPSVTYFDKNPVVSSAVTNELVEFDKDSKDFDLRNKTGPLSGEEIFTDKADNSVVHVEVDGGSVGGGSNNLFSKGDFERWSATTTRWENDRLRISSSNSGGIRFNPDLFELGVKYSLGFKARLVSGEVVGLAGHASSHTVIGYQDEVNLGSWGSSVSAPQKPLEVGKVYDYRLEITKNTEGDYVYIQPNRSGYGRKYEIELFDIQLNKGDTPFEYEGLKPTPDYPIEIHSLNDFDVVSSVGKENLFKGIASIRGVNSHSSGSAILATNIDTPFGKHDIFKYQSGTPSVSLIRWSNALERGHTYTLSVYAKTVNAGKTSRIQLDIADLPSKYSDSGQGNYFDVDDQWRRYEIVTEVPINSTYNFADLAVRREEPVYIAFWQLEYGDGSTPWSSAPEDVSYDINQNGLYKTNISLSEPLRSVGDVKDRLFRDSDGIWKVERSVGEVTLDGTEPWLTEAKHWYMSWSSRYGATKNSFNVKSSHYVWLDSASDDGVTTGISYGGKNLSRKTHNGNLIFYHPKHSNVTEFKKFLESEHLNGTPVITQYELESPEIEILDQDLQDKLNRLKSFKDSNYVYTINNTEGVPEDVKPTLHATFKSEDYGELAKDGLVYPDDITHLTTQVKYGTMVVSELIEGGGAYGNSTTRV